MRWTELFERLDSLKMTVGEWDCENAAHNTGIEIAVEEIEKLCASWQASPVGNGLYWVEGENDPRDLYMLNGEWFLSPRDEGEVSAPLNGRRVCVVIGPPG